MQLLQDTDPAQTLCFFVQAAAEPSILPRLIELFAKRGLVPTALHSRCHQHADGSQHIEIEMMGMDCDLAEYIQRCMGQIVGVYNVLISKKYHLALGKALSAI